jgi:hypothetical protein
LKGICSLRWFGYGVKVWRVTCYDRNNRCVILCRHTFVCQFACQHRDRAVLLHFCTGITGTCILRVTFVTLCRDSWLRDRQFTSDLAVRGVIRGNCI